MKSLLGRTVDKYELTAEIGSGSMGVVFKGVHLTLGRTVAVKMIHPHLLGNSEIVDGFYKEAKIQALLNHPNITTVYDFLELNGACYMIMEYVQGESIGKIVREQGAFHPSVAVSIFLQILDGIRYAHSKRVLHRDIKSSNFLLTPARVKITDFGIAQIIGDRGGSGAVAGTPKYMSPEQILGEKIDHRADIYSLGVTFYEMLTGGIPFGAEGDSVYEIKKGHIKLLPLPPSRINPEIPPDVEGVVLKALEKKPGDRFGTAQELIEALQDCDIKRINLIGTFELSSEPELRHIREHGHTARSVLPTEAVEIPISADREREFDRAGSLASLPYPVLLMFLHFEKRTGILDINSESRLKIYFRDGIIVFVEGETVGLSLGEVLVDGAKITGSDRDRALVFAHETGLKIGEALIRMEKITHHELSAILEAQLKEKLISGFGCKSGSFVFMNTSDLRVEAVYRIQPMQIVYEGVSRLIKLDEIRQDMGFDGEFSYELKVPGTSIREQIVDVSFASPKEIKIVDLLEKGKTLDQAISQSKLKQEGVLRFLYFLFMVGLVQIRKEGSIRTETSGGSSKNCEPADEETRLFSEEEIEKLKEKMIYDDDLTFE